MATQSERPAFVSARNVTTASVWRRLPSQLRGLLWVWFELIQSAECEPAAASRRWSKLAWVFPPADPFRPKAAERRGAKPLLPFPTARVQVPSGVKLRTRSSCVSTYVQKQRIKRRVVLYLNFVKENKHLQVQLLLSKYHNRHQDSQDHDDNG